MEMKQRQIIITSVLACIFAISSIQSHPTSCNPNPCCNGGTCVTPNAGNVFCNCAVNFTGELCTINIQQPHITNPQPTTTTQSTTIQTHPTSCDPNPCSNGGTCLRNSDNVFCNCPVNFTGTLCTVSISEPHVTDPTTTSSTTTSITTTIEPITASICPTISIEKPCYCSAALSAGAIKLVAEPVINLLIKLVKEKIEKEAKDLLNSCDETKLKNAITEADINIGTISDRLEELKKQKKALQDTIECTNPAGNGNETEGDLRERKQQLWNLYDNVVTWTNALNKSKNDMEKHRRELYNHLKACMKKGWWSKTFGKKRR